MNPKSLRKQLSTTLVISLAVLGILGNGLIYSYIKHLDLREFDAELVHEMEKFVATTVIEPDGRLELEVHRFDWPDFRVSPDARFFQLWKNDDSPLMKSASLIDQSLPFLDVTGDEPIIKDLRLPDGRQGRAIWASAIVHPEHPDQVPDNYQPDDSNNRVTIAFAQSREDLDKILGLELLFASLIGALMIIGAVAIVHWLTSRAFKQVSALSEAMGDIDMETLSNRVPESTLPLELQPVALRFNEVLGRLEKGVQREKRFSADIAHELRTPLTALLSLHELAVEECQDGDLEDPGAYSADALMLTQRIHQLTETLSQLHDTSMECQELTLVEVPIQPLLEGAWKDCAKEAQGRSITWSHDCSKGILIATDITIAQALLFNLLNNAVTYSPDGSAIECTVAESDQKVSITIANPITDLEQEDIAHLTEAFWQKDLSRTDTKHVGLGLTLVVAYARLLHAVVQFELSLNGRFKARVYLPKRA
jgi:signal transduction histidine kinase